MQTRLSQSHRSGLGWSLTVDDVARACRQALGAAFPAILHGMRLTVAVCLALGISFYLQLSAPFWAGTSAALVCQPVLGASRRKGEARLVGTVIGAAFAVVLTAAFPQNRLGFLLGIALWCAASGFVATLLENFASYGAALAGYTAVIIASDVTTSPDQIFSLAVSRASEISIGILCATVVMTVSARARAPDRLAGLLGGIIAETTGGLISTLYLAGPDAVDTRPARRELIKRTIALGQPIDEAVGESSELRYRWRGLKAAKAGMFEVLSDWRTIAGHLRRLPDDDAKREAAAIIQALPRSVHDLLASRDEAAWTAKPAVARDACEAASRGMVGFETDRPSVRLLADRMAEAVRGVARAANGVALLTAPEDFRRISGGGTAWGSKDPLPALVNAIRILVTIVAAEVFWIMTEWPSGPTAILFAAINVILLSPKNEQAHSMVVYQAAAVAVAAVLAGVAKFALLPMQPTFAGLCLVLGFILVPLGAVSTLPRLAPLFTPMALNMLPFIGPTNVMSYDTAAFYNQMSAILAGCFLTALALRLIPPVPPAERAYRLLAATLDELRDLAASPTSPSRNTWEARIYSRLSALPEEAEPIERARLVAALSVGTEIIRLRMAARRFGLRAEIAPFLRAIARGNDLAAIGALADFERDLAAVPYDSPAGEIRLRARASARALAEALDTHAAYFSAQARL